MIGLKYYAPGQKVEVLRLRAPAKEPGVKTKTLPEPYWVPGTVLDYNSMSYSYIVGFADGAVKKIGSEDVRPADTAMRGSP